MCVPAKYGAAKYGPAKSVPTKYVPAKYSNNVPGQQAGFTLLELVIGFTVLAIALTMLSSILAPLQQRSSQIWQQVRSAELAQGLLSEISARAFDENSSRSGGLLRCGESGAGSCAAVFPACPASGMTSLTEEANRADWDDVDDYHCWRASGSELTDLLGSTLASRYSGYQLAVTVSYAGSSAGLASNNSAKRITLIITDPQNQTLSFSSLKGNW